MAYKNELYKPNGRSQVILNRAWQHVSSIQYRATSRWLFYRLLQDGFYKGKNDYQTFLSLMSRVRHNNYGPWRPDSLSDDTRRALLHDEGFQNAQQWVEDLKLYSRTPNLDHWYHQKTYIEVWYEAEAMTAQFQHYTRDITLRPFKGMPSIDYKYKIAKSIEEQARNYQLPVVILYFGDYDKAGLTIPETSVQDIEGWCYAEFEFVRCALNEGDGERLGIPENFEKPGTYQWEALPDQPAAELITSWVGKYIDTNVGQELNDQAFMASEKLRDYLQEFAL